MKWSMWQEQQWQQQEVLHAAATAIQIRLITTIFTATFRYWCHGNRDASLTTYTHVRLRVCAHTVACNKFRTVTLWYSCCQCTITLYCLTCICSCAFLWVVFVVLYSYFCLYCHITLFACVLFQFHTHFLYSFSNGFAALPHRIHL